MYGPIVLDDTTNAGRDPTHLQVCELYEIDDGGMDHFTAGDAGSAAGSDCSDPGNFAVASGDPNSSVIAPYLQWASQYALADHYFQPVAGQSSSNDAYLATAKFLFVDNTDIPDTTGYQCTTEVNLPGQTPQASFSNPTEFPGTSNLGDLMTSSGHTLAFYAEGYNVLLDAGYRCPTPNSDCPADVNVAPCLLSPGDDPFLFFPDLANKDVFRDFTQFASDLSGGTLPDVTYIKALDYKTEHPGYGQTLSAGVSFVQGVVSAIQGSNYAKNTLILLTWDEGGGFYDHVSPPPTSPVDDEPYGMRIPIIAMGPYAAPSTISHVVMEHSSIVKFVEWDFLGTTGQLKGRDATVNNLGSLLDPSLAVPTN